MGSCRLPSGADPKAALSAYEKWKVDLLTTEGAGGFVRARRPSSGTQLNSTNSVMADARWGGRGALHKTYRDDEAYEELIAWDELLAGSQYYNKSWSVLGALMLTGRFTNSATRAQGLSAKQ